MVLLVAFLRGINVGGHTVTKTILQDAFVSLGFMNVSTYKQSGNVIFESATDIGTIKTQIQNGRHSILGYDVPAFIRTIAELKNILNSMPFKDQSSEGASFLVTFLPNNLPFFPLPLPTTIPKSTAQVISAKNSEVFSVTHGGGEGALPNPFLEKTLRVKATTRNLNVIKEIVEKYG